MFAILNIIIIVLVLLIAYWWANQGLFSAILHLVAVIAAGAIALAAWEPLVYMQLGGTKWDSYAWGVTLIGVFTICLFIIRFALDRIAPANVDVPHWANLTFGFPIGGAAGVLTMGIVIIGAGHIQSQTVVMGLGGYARSERTGQIERLNGLWLPVHSVTAEFYDYISDTSFWAPNSLREANPQLDRQAVSLIRDSYSNGKGALAMPPDAAEVVAWGATGAGEVGVHMRFDSDAVDFNEQLTLSNSQVRLIGDAPGMSKPQVVHPHAWTQRGQRFRYEAHGYYATSVPGRESAELTFHFRVSGFTPKYIQVRGTRFTLPPSRPGGLGDVSLAEGVELDPGARDITEAIEVANSTRPIVAGTNRLPSGIEYEDNLFTTTSGNRIEFRSTGDRPPRNLRVEGFYAPEGTRIVQVRVDHGSPASIFDKSVMDRIADTARLALVDADGNTYSPIGYMHIKEGGEPPIIMLDPDRFVRTLDKLTILPAGSRDEMKLIFRVTVGAEIAGLVFGDVTIGTCSIPVPPK